MRSFVYFFVVIAGFLSMISLSAQEKIPSFPGAEGAGGYATGGRGGDVYVVTNLNDGGPGSLREAVEASGPRTVVFAVSGTIELQERMRISNGDLTIAGQTAPGDGICLKNYSFTFSANNIIVRYISIRLGVDKRWENDAVNGHGDNIIMDHCSVSFGVDETLSLYSSANLTIQWCIVAASLYDSFHSQGAHGMGGIWGGQPATFHHNLISHHHNRLPRFNGSRYDGDPETERIDHRNNVIYNWITSTCYGGEGGYYNLVNNYYKAGPGTYGSVKRRIVAPRDDNGLWGNFYVSGNYVDGFPEVTADNSLGIDEVPVDLWDEVVSDVPFEMAAPIQMQTPQEAYEEVLKHAGASLPKRDRLDAVITEDVRTGTGTYGSSWPGIIDHPDDMGGYPVLESAPPPADTDMDGMPDDWEDANGLDKNDPEDGKIIQTDGYSNLEHYLNGLVGDFRYMLRPMQVSSAVDDMIVVLTWTDLSDKEDGFILERADGDGDFVEIAQLDADTETYTDNTIDAYGLYTYRLKAYNAEMETCFTDGLEVDVADPNPPYYSVNVNVEGSGNVIMNPDEEAYLTGSDVVLLATAEEGWEFESWGGDVVSTENPLEIKVEEEKNILATFSKISGLDEQKSARCKISVFPVPFSHETTLNIELDAPADIEITLFDLMGREEAHIMSSQLPAGLHQIPIDGTIISRGAYILNVSSNGTTENKLIVRK